MLDGPCHGKRAAGGERPDDHHPYSSGQGIDTGELTFKISKDKQAYQRDDGGDL